MNSIQVFNYGNNEIRTVIIDGEPWLVAKDVCDVLGLVDVSMTVRGLDDDEKGTSSICTPGGMQSMTVINEAGLYKLTFKSRKPAAKEFTRWVTHEVLPQIRKTGSYYIPKSKNKTPVVQEKEKPVLPATSAPIKAAEKIFTKLFKAKNNEDFEAVLALDEAFKLSFGISAISDIAGYEIIQRYDEYHVHGNGSEAAWIDWTSPHYERRKLGDGDKPNENGHYFNYIDIKR